MLFILENETDIMTISELSTNFEVYVAIAGVFVAIAGIIISYFMLKTEQQKLKLEINELKNKNKQELLSFYSEIANILTRMYSNDNKELFNLSPIVKDRVYHREFRRFFTQIPENKNNIEVRKLIGTLLNSADELDKIKANTEYEQLKNLLSDMKKIEDID